MRKAAIRVGFMRSLVVVVDAEAFAPADLVAARELEIRARHLGDELGEAHARLPAELGARVGGVAEQRLDFGRAEVARIDRHPALARAVERPFVDSGALPAELHAELVRRALHELAHAVLLAGGDDEVLRLRLLQDAPLRLDEVARVAPVAPRVEVAEIQALLQ